MEGLAPLGFGNEVFVSNLDEALRLAQRGASLVKRYHTSLPALQEGVHDLRIAIRFVPDDHPKKAECINNLGVSLVTRFECLGDIDDLDEAITVQQQAVRLTPDGHPHKPGRLDNLGNSLRIRFEQTGDIGDLREAITAQQQAVRLTPDGHPRKSAHLANLGTSLRTRFERLGDIGDLEEAITAQQQAVHLTLTPDGHPHNSAHLANLGTSLRTRFERLGDIGDLDEAITAQQQAVRLTPDGHPHNSAHLSNLGTSLRTRFEPLYEIGDLQEAITAQQEAVRLTPDGHPHKPGNLTNFGTSLRTRFECLGDIGDLDEAITAQQQAVCLTPDGHPHKPGNLANFGTSLLHRFERLGDIGDLDEATTAQQQAVNLTPDNHPNKPAYLNNLGMSLVARFERLGDIDHLDEGITAQQQALVLTPNSHPPNKPENLANLRNSSRARFEQLGDIGDLEEAITAHQQAVDLTPDGLAKKPGYLSNLGTCLHTQFRHQPESTTLARAISAYSQSAKSSSGPPSVRFAAAREWARLCFPAHVSEALDACSTLIELLPHVVWLGRTVEQRYRDISALGDPVVDAVTIAVHIGEFNLALEWLEQGRSIVWGQMLQLRSPLDELRRHHPDEAAKLEKISHDLDSAGTIPPGAFNNNLPHSLEAAAQAHRRLAREYDRVLAHIRDLPGFGEFLRPKKSASFCHAVTSGPVIVVNAHPMRCDALILLPHSLQVSHVPLPALQVAAVKKMQIQLAELTRGVGALLPDILEQLWLCIVEPVLSHLSVSCFDLCRVH